MGIWHKPNIPIKPPPEDPHRGCGVLVVVHDKATRDPIDGARVLVEVAGGKTYDVATSNGGAWFYPVPMNTPFILTVTAEKYRPFERQPYGGVGLPNNTLPVDLESAKPPRPSPVLRPPLPPPPPGSYDHVLPFTPPVGPDRNFYRGNFCGPTVPGLQLLPGMAGYTVPGWRDNKVGGQNPPIMALDIPRYWHVSKDLVAENLNAHAIRFFTHLQCSIGHAIEQGLSLDDYIEYSKLVQDIVGFADHWFIGGGPWSARDNDGNWTEARDRDRAYWAPKCDPWIDALLANKAIDCACVGWQLDGGNKPGRPMQSIIDYFADRLRPHDIPIGTHWLNEAGGWWDPSEPGYGGNDARFVWWKNQRGKVQWFHHQGNVDMSIGDYQAKMVDTLQPFGDGRMGAPNEFGLVVYECSAQAQFDLRMSEDVGDQRGFLLSCTKAASHVAGFGNGARYPDGRPI